jgi:hypothetical protein
MLRASAIAGGLPVDLRAIGDPTIDLGVPGGAPLLSFTDALIDGVGIGDARARLVAAVGEEGAVRAALTAGNFEMMNRVVDATGVPVPPSMAEVFAAVGVSTPGESPR